ncbi:hypothetical protein COO60DRAFT_1668682 [Scenedesmus sp. NREL 46B-D3]|nr:hypothetical protein COO60DRAFT_1668682 [Scenedesmus sp. NREL 46B-D3]
MADPVVRWELRQLRTTIFPTTQYIHAEAAGAAAAATSGRRSCRPAGPPAAAGITSEPACIAQTSLAAAVADCALQGLLQSLSSKAEGGELEQLRQQPAGKADRAKLYALLTSMAGVGVGAAGGEVNRNADDGGSAGGSGGDGAGAAVGAGSTGQVTSAAQLSKLLLQVALLQERTSGKADTAAAADISSGLAAARQELPRLRDLLAETAAQRDVEVLRRRLDTQQQHLARLAQQVTGSSAGASASGAHVVSGRSSSSSSSISSSSSSSAAAAAQDLSRAGAGACTAPV